MRLVESVADDEGSPLGARNHNNNNQHKNDDDNVSEKQIPNHAVTAKQEDANLFAVYKKLALAFRDSAS